VSNNRVSLLYVTTIICADSILSVDFANVRSIINFYYAQLFMTLHIDKLLAIPVIVCFWWYEWRQKQGGSKEES
jgi:hypothetical protein